MNHSTYNNPQSDDFSDIAPPRPGLLGSRSGPPRPDADDCYFGCCPVCHKPGVTVHLTYKDHWAVCVDHNMRWPTGSGIISVPDEFDSERLYAENRARLADMREVQPWFPATRDNSTNIAPPRWQVQPKLVGGHPRPATAITTCSSDAVYRVLHHIGKQMEEAGRDYLSLLPHFSCGGDVDTSRDAYLLWYWLMGQLEREFFSVSYGHATSDDIDDIPF